MIHRSLPWGEFLTQANDHMPQVYWGKGARKVGLLPDGRYLAVTELEASVAQLRALKNLPFLHVGRVSRRDGHSNPRPAEITAFLERSRALGFTGASFWNWDSLRPAYPGSAARAETIRSFRLSPVTAQQETFIPHVTR